MRDAASMAERFPGWDRDALFDEVRRAPRHAKPWAADTRLVEDAGWYQLMTPSSPSPALNEVLWTDRPEADPEALVEVVIDGYRRQGSAFKWADLPGALPAGIGACLRRRGFTVTPLRGMAIDPRGAHDPSGAPGVTVVQVEDEALLETWIETMARAWEMDLAPFREPYRLAFAGPDRPHLFLAYADGVPAGTGGLVLHPRSGYLIGAAVISAYRRRGLYTALVHARLRATAAAGRDLATTHAREASSVPILERLGFETILRYDLYTSPPATPARSR